MIVTKHTVIVYVASPLTGQRVISAAHDCNSQEEAERMGRALAGMVGGVPGVEVVLYTEYDEDTAGREPGDVIQSWDGEEMSDPFPLEYEQL